VKAVDEVSLEEHARRIESEIAELVRRAHRKLFGAGAPAPRPLRLTLDLSVPPAAAAESLAGQVVRAVRMAASMGEAFRPGRVFCYRCESASCEHSGAPRPQSVFGGYGPTGVPQWTDFAQLLLDLKDARVDELFEDPPATVARLIYGRELKGRQLHPFGRASKRYDLLGQLVAGYFGARPDTLSAVTVQAVESRYADGRTRLALNVVGAAPPDPAFADALRSARVRLEGIEEDLARSEDSRQRSQRLRRVPGLLLELGRSIERAARQRGRRTRHAEKRREERRPTQTAMRDVREAGDGSFYRDEERSTLIVVGPRGRVHAFTAEGRHVTTLTLEGDALERRLRRERWRPARGDEIAEFRRSLAILNR
jgi:hypothetical protein